MLADSTGHSALQGCELLFMEETCDFSDGVFRKAFWIASRNIEERLARAHRLYRY